MQKERPHLEQTNGRNVFWWHLAQCLPMSTSISPSLRSSAARSSAAFSRALLSAISLSVAPKLYETPDIRGLFHSSAQSVGLSL